jgi:glycosyltransferase involved in cell wall biosynthesis
MKELINLDIVSTGNINNKNGVNTFMINIFKNQKLFKCHQINLNRLIVGGKVIKTNDSSNNEIVKNHNDNKLIKYLKYIKSTTIIGNIASFIINGPLQGIKNIRIVNKFKDDKTIFVQDIFSCLFYKKGNNKIIMTIHSSDNPLIQTYYNYPKFKGTFMENIMEYLLDKAILKCDATIVLGDVFKNQLINKGYENIYTVYNGIPKSKFIKKEKINQNSKVKIITVASINYRKGIDILIEAFLKLEIKYRNKISITIVGTGVDIKKFKALVSDNKLENHIKFLGLRNNIIELLVQNDIFLLPSRDEGLPIAMLEAMSVGLPLALTNVGSIPEVMEKDTYYPLEPTINSLVIFYQKLINNTIDLNKLSDKSVINFDNKFSINTMINKYCEIIKKVNY